MPYDNSNQLTVQEGQVSPSEQYEKLVGLGMSPSDAAQYAGFSPFQANPQPSQSEMKVAVARNRAGQPVNPYDLSNLTTPFTEGMAPGMVGTIKGTLSSIPGVFGDIESLGRMGLNYLSPGIVNKENTLPTTEDYYSMFPQFYKNGPAAYSENIGGAGGRNIVGGVIDPFAVAKGVTSAAPAIAKGAKALGETAASKILSSEPLVPGAKFLNPPVMSMIKPKGGQWPTSFGSGDLIGQGNLGNFIDESMHYHDLADNPSPFTLWWKQLEENPNPKVWDETNNFIEDYKSEYPMPEGDPKAAALWGKDLRDAVTRHINGTDLSDEIIKHENEIETIQNAYNNWIQGPYANYITKRMGTGKANDPLVQLADQGWYPKDHVRNPLEFADQAAERREAALRRGDTKEAGETANTSRGMEMENVLDSAIRFSNPEIMKEKYSWHGKDMPFLNKADPGSIIYDLGTDTILDKYAGLKDVRKAAWDDLMSGKETPESIKNRSMEYYAKKAWVNEAELEKQLAKDQKAYEEWRQKRHEELIADKDYSDGSKMILFNSSLFNGTPEEVKIGLRDLSVDTKDLNHCLASGGHNCSIQYKNRHAPIYEPHTGTTPAGASETPFYNHIENIKNDREAIASLRGPNGEAQATIHLEPIGPYGSGGFDIRQIAGYNNGKVDSAFSKHLKEWLNNPGFVYSDEIRHVSKDLENNGIFHTHTGEYGNANVSHAFDSAQKHHPSLNKEALDQLMDELHMEGYYDASNEIAKMYKNKTGKDFYDTFGDDPGDAFASTGSPNETNDLVQIIKREIGPSKKLEDALLAFKNHEEAVARTMPRFVDLDDIKRLAKSYNIDLIEPMQFLDKKVVSPDEMPALKEEWDKWNRIHDFDPNGHQYGSYVEHLKNLIENTKNVPPGHKNGGIIKLASGGAVKKEKETIKSRIQVLSAELSDISREINQANETKIKPTSQYDSRNFKRKFEKE